MVDEFHEIPNCVVTHEMLRSFWESANAELVEEELAMVQNILGIREERRVSQLRYLVNEIV